LYCREADSGMLFSDPALGIKWPDLGMELKLSEKDTKHPLFKDIEPWEEK
jgi:dTDP-4-dehydrorhamnose 3,5-epimerase